MAGLIYTVRHLRWEGLSLVPTFIETQTYDRERDLFIRTQVTNLDMPGGPRIGSRILTRDEAGANREEQW